MKLVLTSALFGALFLISGCATQCESICASFNQCNVAHRAVQVDCANYCGNVDALNARAAKANVGGCDAKWKDHLACWQKNVAKKVTDPNDSTKQVAAICDTTFADCDDTAIAWSDCVDAYCAGLSSTAYDPECSNGTNLIPSPFESGF